MTPASNRHEIRQHIFNVRVAIALLLLPKWLRNKTLRMWNDDTQRELQRMRLEREALLRIKRADA